MKFTVVLHVHEHRVRMFEKRLLRKILLTEGESNIRRANCIMWSYHDYYKSPNTNRVIKSWRIS